MFRQRDIFNILVYDRRLKHRELRTIGNLTREFDTGDIVVLRKEVKSIRKDGIAQKRIQNKGTLQIPGEGYTRLILVAAISFLWGPR